MGLILVAEKALDIDSNALLIPYIGNEIDSFSCRDLPREYKDKKFKSIIYFNANDSRLTSLAKALKIYKGFKRIVIPYSYLRALGYSVGEIYDILLKILVDLDSDITLIVSLAPCFRVSKKSFYNDILNIERVLKKIYNVDNKIIEKERIRLYREDINEFISSKSNKYNYINSKEALDSSLKINRIDEFSFMIDEAKDYKKDLKAILIRLLDAIEVSSEDERNLYLEYGTHILNKIFLLTKREDALLDPSATNVGLFIRNRIGKSSLEFKQVISQKQIEDYENERTSCSKITIYTVALFLGLNLTQMLQLMTLAGQGFTPLDNVDRVVSSFYLNNDKPSLRDFLMYITDKNKGQAWLDLCKDVKTQFNADAFKEEYL